MNITEGQLKRSQVVSEYGPVLEAALEERLTGYSRIEPGDNVVLEADGAGILTFKRGIPMAAYHTVSEATGEAALEALSKLGPFYVEVYTVGAEALQPVHETDTVLIPPERPAELLAGDPALAEQIRSQAAPGQQKQTRTPNEEALISFLSDEKRVQQIKDEARKQARRRAEQWNLDAELLDER